MRDAADGHDQLVDVLDRQRDEERRRAVRALLRHPLLTSAEPEAFVLVRRHAAWLREWFAREAGWSLHVEGSVARLRKVPGEHGDATRAAGGPLGAKAFSRRRYVLTCLALAALERAESQVTLGWLVDRILAFSADPELVAAGVEFTLDSREERADLVAVARLLMATGVLTRVAGDEQAFVNRSGDALYDVDRRVLAVLLVARRGPSTVSTRDFAERLRAITEDVVPDTEDGRNRAIRHALTRRLLDDPVLYYADLTEEERAYLTSQRTHLLRRLTEATGLVPEVRAEGIALLDPTGETTDLGMPEEGTDGHAALLLAEYLAAALRERPGEPVAVSDLREHVARLARRHRTHWRKTATEPGAERELTEQSLRRLEALGLVRRDGDAVLPLPALARFAYAEPNIVGETTA
ncbi:hypothetical protein TH66_18965 [Carbonactinospora thermoautotrophica]|uniref:TIGR02678 family protein n=1 Tax=Carbonactinospora thermoautotrophica TaxID=1469144 RepID=A0A132MIQ3_9ACTN|nr:TIGR02678 family protein [Carbonactinospora thermoautotrophica]KWW97635.1 hypothetical protein TH66_18965 [Carbonactinospora thermoautotrophica]KWW99018.1 hypothetical protein LI90_650 [Carbonactinospora thermoautotrophica]KWX10176.1 hypothetical protein TR74_05205 [Carbonactinospora thermoautotrophica]